MTIRALAVLLLVFPLLAGAQPYPSRPVHFVVGGGTPAALAAAFRNQVENSAGVMKTTGITANQ